MGGSITPSDSSVTSFAFTNWPPGLTERYFDRLTLSLPQRPNNLPIGPLNETRKKTTTAAQMTLPHGGQQGAHPVGHPVGVDDAIGEATGDAIGDAIGDGDGVTFTSGGVDVGCAEGPIVGVAVGVGVAGFGDGVGVGAGVAVTSGDGVGVGIADNAAFSAHHCVAKTIKVSKILAALG
jgi:hypothetical protein